MFVSEINFYFPKLIFLIVLLVPFYYGKMALRKHRKQFQSLFASSKHVSQLIIPRSSLMKWTKFAGWSCVWIFLTIAAMQPYGNERYSSVSDPSLQTTSSWEIPSELIFLVDASASMGVQDGYEEETRLDSAKQIIEDTLDQLQGQTVSLFTFTSKLYSIVPPTSDTIFTRLALNDLKLETEEGGTHYESVLKDLNKQVFSESLQKHYTVIFLSDGGDNRLESTTGEKYKQVANDILNAFPSSKEDNFQFYTIGIGSSIPHPIPRVIHHGKPVFSKLEPEILKQLAIQGKGKYENANDWTSWELAQNLITQVEKNQESFQKKLRNQEKSVDIKKEEVIVDWYYQIPLGLALFFYLLNFILPDVWRR